MWIAPPLPSAEDDVLRGVLGGDRLYEQPAHQAQVAALLAFLAAPGPVHLEVGVDYGGRLLALAEAAPQTRFIGLEIKKPRVAELSAIAPPNCRFYAADARVLLDRVIPAGRLDRVDVLFPTPTFEAAHLLWTPRFARTLRRALREDGLLHSETDIEGLHHHIGHLLAGWPPAPPPPPAPVPSRRQRGCAREGWPIYTLDRRRPAAVPAPA